MAGRIWLLLGVVVLAVPLGAVAMFEWQTRRRARRLDQTRRLLELRAERDANAVVQAAIARMFAAVREH